MRPILLGDEQVCGPVEAFVAQPSSGEAVTAMLGEYRCDRGLIDLGRGSGEGERDLSHTPMTFDDPTLGIGVDASQPDL